MKDKIPNLRDKCASGKATVLERAIVDCWDAGFHSLAEYLFSVRGAPGKSEAAKNER